MLLQCSSETSARMSSTHIPMRLTAAWLLLAASADAFGIAARAPVQRSSSLCMGLFDGVKDAFGGDKPIPAADRVTPFDKWLGLDNALVEEETPDESAAYIDPNDVANYFSVSLGKPMGIAFVENEGGGGVYVDEVLSEGSAASLSTKLEKGDQLVGVDATLVAGSDFDGALDIIKGTTGESTKLTFFRGPT